MSRQITIVGRGMNPLRDLTLEGLSALQTADHIIGIEPNLKAWSTIQNTFGISDIHDVSELYIHGSRDIENYERFIDLILELSRQHQKLVILVAGHPRLGVSFIDLLQTRLSSDIKLKTVAGISSFCALLNELPLDPLERGSSIIDVNRMLLFQYQLEPALDTFLYHVCSIGTSYTFYQDATEANQFELLRNYLLKFYSKDKKLFWVKASHATDDGTERVGFYLEELCKSVSHVDFGTSLFIPAELPNKIDKTYLNLLRK